MGYTLSGHWTDDFKVTLNKITIYVGATYGHNMGMTPKSQKEAVIPQIDDPKDNTDESNKYISPNSKTVFSMGRN